MMISLYLTGLLAVACFTVASSSPDFPPPNAYTSLSGLDRSDRRVVNAITRHYYNGKKSCGNDLADLIVAVCRDKIPGPRSERKKRSADSTLYAMMKRQNYLREECCESPCEISHVLRYYCEGYLI